MKLRPPHITIFLILFSISCRAEMPSTIEKHNHAVAQTSIQTGLEQIQTTPSSPALSTSKIAPSKKEINNDFLLQNPALFHQIMQQAINSQDVLLIQELIEIYPKLAQADVRLMQLAYATLSRKSGQYSQALQQYQTLQAIFPNDARIQLDTAAVLFEDRQWNESESQFQSVLQNHSLPENVQRNVYPYLNKIHQIKQWNITGGVSISRHTNINHAAPNYCTPVACHREKPQTAIGLNYRVNISKQTPLYRHHSLISKTEINGINHYFSQQSQYDMAWGRSYLGWQWQTAKRSLSILPFYQVQFAGSHEFENKPVQNKKLSMDLLAHATGIQMLYTQKYSPKLGSYLLAEYHRNHYRPSEKSERYNGTHLNLSIGSHYQITPKQNVFAHFSYQRFSPQNQILQNRPNHAAYTRYQLGMGWQSYWPHLGGLQTQIQASIAHRHYQGQALNESFEWKSQKNQEYSAGISLAHEKVHFAGFSPKFVWEKTQIHSSHAWAKRKHSDFYIEVVKKF